MMLNSRHLNSSSHLDRIIQILFVLTAAAMPFNLRFHPSISFFQDKIRLVDVLMILFIVFFLWRLKSQQFRCNKPPLIESLLGLVAAAFVSVAMNPVLMSGYAQWLGFSYLIFIYAICSLFFDLDEENLEIFARVWVYINTAIGVFCLFAFFVSFCGWQLPLFLIPKYSEKMQAK